MLKRGDRRMARSDGTRHLASRRVTRERVLEPRHLAIEHRDIQMASRAAQITLAQGRQNCDDAIESRCQIADRYAAAGGLAVSLTGYAHGAAERLRDDVIGGRRRHRTGLPEA